MHRRKPNGQRNDQNRTILSVPVVGSNLEVTVRPGHDRFGGPPRQAPFGVSARSMTSFSEHARSARHPQCTMFGTLSIEDCWSARKSLPRRRTLMADAGAASRMARTCLVVDACPTVVVEMAIVTTISNHGRSREGLDSSSQLAYECRPDSNMSVRLLRKPFNCRGAVRRERVECDG